ncbi:hypothetical protein ACP70R_038108 [Stipagrostis hirtigluma subsp. patula]
MRPAAGAPFLLAWPEDAGAPRLLALPEEAGAPHLVSQLGGGGGRCSRRPGRRACLARPEDAGAPRLLAPPEEAGAPRTPQLAGQLDGGGGRCGRGAAPARAAELDGTLREGELGLNAGGGRESSGLTRTASDGWRITRGVRRWLTAGLAAIYALSGEFRGGERRRNGRRSRWSSGKRWARAWAPQAVGV